MTEQQEKNGWTLINTKKAESWQRTNPPLEEYTFFIKHTCGEITSRQGLLVDTMATPVRPPFGVTCSTRSVYPLTPEEKAEEAERERKLYSTPKLYPACKWWEADCYECSKCPTCGLSPLDY